MFTAGFTTDYFTYVEAIKSQRTISKFDFSTNICGVELCSDIPGGKTAWEEGSQKITSVTPVEFSEMD